MKKVVLIAPMEANGRYRGGIMTVANTLYQHKDDFKKRGIVLEKFNTYIRQRKAESTGKIDINNFLNMLDILKGLLKVTSDRSVNTLYYHSSIKTSLLKDLIIIRMLRCFQRKQRIVLHIHFAEIEKIMPKQHFIRKWMINTLKKYVNHIVFLSKETRNEFVDVGISDSMTSVIYNFHDGLIDETRFREKICRIERKEKVDLLFMGSLEKRKGILDLLDALHGCEEHYILHVCGGFSDDSIEADYAEKIKLLGNNVIEHGFVTGEEKRRVLESADCMILPSYGEGFPLVLIEAMAYGCMSITTPVGAVPEFFRQPQNGYLFSVGNVNELRGRIQEICNDREMTANQMAVDYTLASEFSVDSFIELICKVF